MSIYVVTGANRGIGRGIVDKLAKHLKEHSAESIVYLTSRKSEDGDEAVKELSQQGFNNVRSAVLDVTNRESVESLAKLLKEKHPAGIDVLINNAGYASKGSEINDKIAEETILPNYYGLKQVTKALLPLIKPNGRVINVTSQAGVLANSYREDLKQKFLDPNLAESEIDALVENFRKSVREDTVEQNGWPKSTYKVSKVAANAYTRILARDLQKNGDDREKSIFVAALCPGWVKTRMGGPNASLSVEEGADTPYWLAVESLDKLRDRNGLFWYQRHLISW